MAAKKIQIEGIAEFGGTEFLCVCGFCNHHERENATIEFNFRDKKVFFHCPECKNMNEIFFGQKLSAPLPRIGMSR